jgi:hypothetical protein
VGPPMPLTKVKLTSKPWRMMLLRVVGRSGGVIRVLATALLLVVVPRPSVADTAILSGMPTYYWWGGCSPTAGGPLTCLLDQSSS